MTRSTWDYEAIGGIVGFLLNRGLDPVFHACFQLEIFLSLVFGFLILLLIWITK